MTPRIAQFLTTLDGPSVAIGITAGLVIAGSIVLVLFGGADDRRRK